MTEVWYDLYKGDWKKWENKNENTSHIKVSRVHNAEECRKECTATAP